MTAQRQTLPVAYTVYECSNCGERFVGQRRCPECGLFGRALGLGGPCPDCSELILLADVVGREVVIA
jgi:DNA-directed RNA polymerase subunit RPC12/RpoP